MSRAISQDNNPSSAIRPAPMVPSRQQQRVHLGVDIVDIEAVAMNTFHGAK